MVSLQLVVVSLFVGQINAASEPTGCNIPGIPPLPTPVSSTCDWIISDGKTCPENWNQLPINIQSGGKRACKQASKDFKKAGFNVKFIFSGDRTEKQGMCHFVDGVFVWDARETKPVTHIVCTKKAMIEPTGCSVPGVLPLPTAVTSTCDWIISDGKTCPENSNQLPTKIQRGGRIDCKKATEDFKKAGFNVRFIFSGDRTEKQGMCHFVDGELVWDAGETKLVKKRVTHIVCKKKAMI